MPENQDVVSEEHGAIREEEDRLNTVHCDKRSQSIRFGTLFIRGLIKARVSSGRNPDPTAG
jgi:Rad3-related DNA helicase